MIRLRRYQRPLALFFLLSTSLAAGAAVVQGRVTDTLGLPIAGATITLISKGKVIASSISSSDGSYAIRNNASGRFYAIVASNSFKQIATQSFYAGVLDEHLQNIVLEPAAVRQQIVVTATGTPTAQAQLSSSTTVVQRPEFRNQAFLVDALRQSPGVFVVQTGMYGGVTSLFVRGGTSTSNKVLMDGTSIEDIGGHFDYSNLSSTGTAQLEVYRGPDSVLYGSDSAAGVVSLTTPEGSTAFPSLFYEGDAGNFHTWRNELQLGGTLNKLDYYLGTSYFESSNALPQNEYRNLSEVLNLGYALTSATSIHVTGRNADSSVGLPGAYNLYGLTNDGKQGDQDTYFTGLIDQQTNLKWHNSVQYGLTRKREQANQWYPAGNLMDGNYYGNPVEIEGANGYSAFGQALLNYGPTNYGIYPNETELASNRDQLYAQSSYQVTSHVAAVLGFRYEDERGEARSAAYFYNYNLERSNYDYLAEIKGDFFKSRVFYTLGGGVEKNQLFGTVGQPQIGLTYYPVRPGIGYAHGTKITFSFSKGVQEPDIFSQFDSVYALLAANGYADIATRNGIGPIKAENSRTYDGGVEQSFLSQRLLFGATYFHSEFGNQIEFVSANQLLQLGVAQSVVTQIDNIFGGADVNTLAYRAQGIETRLQSQITSRIFVRGGYTYTDPVVQKSFSPSATGPSTNPNFPGVPIGASSPLVGARPFRLAPHVGFVGMTYTGRKISGTVQGSFASRSDDSTFLAGLDLRGGNSLLLPNRNLDAAYSKIDIGISYQALPFLAVYAQGNNLVSDQHIGPIGYPSLPATVRVGLRLQVGHQHK
jgi:iron complex outermembrane receptor protein/vitamin B12 transporter